MSQPVVIENDVLRLLVWPQIGGKVSSIIDKADKYELMFNYPNELPIGPQYDVPFDQSWYAGWDECFPAIAPGGYVGHPYEGISVPDHGELWGLPTMAVPTKDGITTVWHGLRFGYRLTRKLFLEGTSLVASYTLINLAPFDFKFVWAMHSLMAMNQRVNLEFPDGGAFRFSHDGEGKSMDQPFVWPTLADGCALDRPDQLPPKRGWKLFSNQPINRPMRVVYPSRARQVAIEYSSPEPESATAYWGIWINTGGWSGHRHFAIEPTTGRYDHIHRSIADRTAATLPGSGRREWSVRWTVGNVAH